MGAKEQEYTEQFARMRRLYVTPAAVPLSPRQQADQALIFMVDSLALCGLLTDGTIKEMGGPTFTLIEMPENKPVQKVELPYRKLSEGEMFSLAWNLSRGVQGIVATAIHEALTAAFGSVPTHATLTEQESIRTWMYMIRCAFAHNPMAPTWEVRGAFRRVLSIPSIPLQVDTAKLDGKSLTREHIGGAPGFVKLLTLARDIIPK